MAKAALDGRAEIGRPVSERARALHDEALVWDMTLPWLVGYADEDITLPRFKQAGVDFISLTVNDFPGSIAGTMRQIAAVTAHVRARAGTMVLISSVDDIVAAKKAGKLALAFNLQETNPLEGEADLVQTYFDLGVRYMLLAYNQKNRVGDGCAERTDAGLSRFGVRMIEEMNRVGMLVDGAHSGYRTTMEAMEVSTAPFIFSHCLAHEVFAHYRNIRDDQIIACARSGGVIGVNGVGIFLEDAQASSEAMFRHVDHIANLVGPEHIGLGLDYVRDTERLAGWTIANADMWPPNAGKPTVPTTFAQPEQIVELADIMLERQYSESDVRGILGENYARVARQVWKQPTFS